MKCVCCEQEKPYVVLSGGKDGMQCLHCDVVMYYDENGDEYKVPLSFEETKRLMKNHYETADKS